MLDICFSFTDDSGEYYRHPLVALTSVFENTRASISAHVLSDGSLTAEGRDAFIKLAERYGQRVSFYTVPEIQPDVLANVRAVFGVGSLFRLFIPELVSASRVIYLDCDTICNLDMDEFFSLIPDEVVFAGVGDIGISRRKEQRERLSAMRISVDRYINAGVLYMNLDMIRSKFPDFGATVFGYIAESRLPYMDQDALNMFFQYNDAPLMLLPERYNFLVGGTDRPFLPGGEYEGKILHFTRDKPWKALYPAAMWYWKYFSVCLGPEVAFDRMCRLGQHEYAYLFHFVLRKPGVRRILNRLFDIDRLGIKKALFKRIFPSRKLKTETLGK